MQLKRSNGCGRLPPTGRSSRIAANHSDAGTAPPIMEMSSAGVIQSDDELHEARSERGRGNETSTTDDRTRNRSHRPRSRLSPIAATHLLHPSIRQRRFIFAIIVAQFMARESIKFGRMCCTHVRRNGRCVGKAVRNESEDISTYSPIFSMKLSPLVSRAIPGRAAAVRMRMRLGATTPNHLVMAARRVLTLPSMATSAIGKFLCPLSRRSARIPQT